MKTPRTLPTIALTGLLALALSACDADKTDEHAGHDHAADGAEDTMDDAMDDGMDAMEGAKDDAMDGAKKAADGMKDGIVMKKIEPSADYPLDTCVVSGEALTSMDGPIAYEVEGVEVQFCCESCVADFKASPEEYLAKVRAAKR